MTNVGSASTAPAQPLLDQAQVLLDRISDTNAENLEILHYLSVALIGEKAAPLMPDNTLKPGVENGQIGQIVGRLDLRATEVNTVNHLLRVLRDNLLS